MRRIETPVTFTAAEAERIKTQLRRHSADLQCPLCRSDLTFGPSVSYEGHAIRELYCPTCHRCLMVRDVASPDD